MIRLYKMKILLKDYNVTRSCTNPSCGYYTVGSCFNHASTALVDVKNVIGEPTVCTRCNIGVLSVKKASFATEKRKKQASNEIRYVVECTKCHIVWTSTKITPLDINEVNTVAFLKASSLDRLECKQCKSNTNVILLHVTKL